MPPLVRSAVGEDRLLGFCLGAGLPGLCHECLLNTSRWTGLPVLSDMSVSVLVNSKEVIMWKGGHEETLRHSSLKNKLDFCEEGLFILLYKLIYLG